MALPLGFPMPDDPHAISVSLPKYDDNVGWGQQRPEIVNKIQTGYPRFYIHQLLRELIEKALTEHGLADLQGLVFPTLAIASACSVFVAAQTSTHPRVLSFTNADDPWSEYHVVVLTKDEYPWGRKFWQYVGEGLSSRRAEQILARKQLDEIQLRKSENAKLEIRQRIASLQGQSRLQEGDIYLYPTGMSAIFRTHQTITSAMMQPRRKGPAICFGFPYCDTLRILNFFNVNDGGVKFYGRGDEGDLRDLEEHLKTVPTPSVLFCEIPSNPLLYTPNLKEIRRLADTYGFPVVVDHTLSTSSMVDIFDVADVLCESLSKTFSGKCNVMGGTAILNPKSRFYPQLQEAFDSHFIDLYYPLDALVMASNSRGFPTRIRRMNDNAARLYHFLSSSPLIAKVYFPISNPGCYEDFRRMNGGWGFLMSLKFKEPEMGMKFYDVLDVCKGPSLGTEFTLVCPYTLLSHSKELEWAAKWGVDRYIVRVSVGAEEWGDLEMVFAAALREVAE